MIGRVFIGIVGAFITADVGELLAIGIGTIDQAIAIVVVLVATHFLCHVVGFFAQTMLESFAFDVGAIDQAIAVVVEAIAT